MTHVAQGLLLDDTIDVSARKPQLVAVDAPIAPELSPAEARANARRRHRPAFYRRDRQLKLVLLPPLAPAPADASAPILDLDRVAATIASVTERTDGARGLEAPIAFKASATGVRTIQVNDESMRDAGVAAGDALLIGGTGGDALADSPAGVEFDDGALLALRVSDGPLCLRRVFNAGDDWLHLQAEDPEIPVATAQRCDVSVEGKVITIVRAVRGPEVHDRS